MTVEMRNPYGVVVRVSEEKAVQLERAGYRRADEVAPKRKPGRPKKVQEADDGVSDS